MRTKKEQASVSRIDHEVFRAWLRTLPPRQELALRVALRDRVASMTEDVGWALRIDELRRRLRFTSRDAMGKLRASQAYADALRIIEGTTEKRDVPSKKKAPASRPAPKLGNVPRVPRDGGIRATDAA